MVLGIWEKLLKEYFGEKTTQEIADDERFKYATSLKRIMYRALEQRCKQEGHDVAYPTLRRILNTHTNAKEFFDDLDLPVELVHLTGSVELGPITGMAEAIVDLVATGRTLKDNGLVEIEQLFYSTARLIGNPLSLRLDNGKLQQIIDEIRAHTNQSKVSR